MVGKSDMGVRSMEYRRFGDTYVVRMDPGEEIVSGVIALCQREDVRLASVEAIGAVDHAVVGIYDTVNGRFQERAFDEPMEISALSGNVTRRDGQVHAHLHATLCDGEQRAFGGHAIELRISVTCEMFIRALPGEVGRRVDADTGLTTFMFD